MMRKTLFRAISFLIAAGLLLTQMAACGGDGKNVPEKTTLRIMSWNEDFRDMMEKYFIPRHEKLMKNVEIEWIITEINS